MLFLSHLSLLVAFLFKRVHSSTTSVNKNCVSLLDSGNSNSSLCVSSGKYDEQLRDLITFSGDPGASEVRSEILKEVERDDRRGHIDDLMLANITNFAKDACKSSALYGPFLGVSTVVKRR